jgi:hypothetical protein
MRFIIILFLFISNPCIGATYDFIFGKYENKNRISYICHDENNHECICYDGSKPEDEFCYTSNIDTLSILPNYVNIRSILVKIETTVNNFEMCSFNGSGYFEEDNDRLVVKENNFDAESCEIVLFFKEKSVHLVARPVSVCNNFCGLNAGIDGLTFYKDRQTASAQ